MPGGGNASSVGPVLPYLIAVNVIVGLLVSWAIWSFRSGRWVEEQTNAHADLQHQIGEVSKDTRRDLSDLKIGLVEEHKQRREFVDRFQDAIQDATTTIARHDERIKTIEGIMKPGGGHR